MKTTLYPPPLLLRSHPTCSRTILFALLFAVVMGSAVALPRLQARLDVPLAVVFPPWWSPEAALTAAARSGVDILGAGPTQNILIVRSSDARFVGQLYRQGAWSVLSAGGASDCATVAAAPLAAAPLAAEMRA